MSAIQILIDWNRKQSEAQYQIDLDKDVYFHNIAVIDRCETEFTNLNSQIASLEARLAEALERNAKLSEELRGWLE
jgi:hypothetical protein